MKQQKEGGGNVYFEVRNIRITATKEDNFGGGPSIRIQAYKDLNNNKKLHLATADSPTPKSAQTLKKH